MSDDQQTFWNNPQVNQKKAGQSYDAEIEHGDQVISKGTAVSLLFKTCRLNDGNAALHWYLVLRKKFNFLPFNLFKILNQLAGEDCAPCECRTLYPMIQAGLSAIQNDTLNWHQEMQTVYAVAMAKKWYQTESGQHLENCRQFNKTLIGGKGEKNGDLEELKVPLFAFDNHTKEFWTRFRNKEEVDLRLCGVWENRFNIRDRWEKLKEESGDAEYEYIVQDWVKLHYEPQTEQDKEVGMKAHWKAFDARKKSGEGDKYKIK